MMTNAYFFGKIKYIKLYLEECKKMLKRNLVVLAMVAAALFSAFGGMGAAFAEEAHTFVLTDNGDGTHTKKCSGCGFEENEAHSFLYSVPDGDYLSAVCSCGALSGVKGAEGDLRGDFFSGNDQVDLTSASCVKGEAYYGEGADRLFTDTGKLCGSGWYAEADGMRHLSADFVTNSPIRVIGLKIETGDDTAQYPDRNLKAAVLYGKEKFEESFSEIAYIPLDGFIKAENNKKYTFLFDNAADINLYDDYEIDFLSNDYNIQISSVDLLCANGEMVEFELSGVVAEKTKNFTAAGEAYECTLFSQDGHPESKNVSVTLDGAAFTGYSYNESTGLLHIGGANVKDGKYVISASAEIHSVSVRASGHRITFKGGESASFCTDYTCLLLDNNGELKWAPENDDITINIGGKRLYDFKYDEESGTLTIPGEYIFGDIDIWAAERASTFKATSVASVKKNDDVLRFYDSINEACSADYGDTLYVTLLKNTTTDDLLMMRFGKVTLDLGGYTLSEKELGCIITSGSDLTIKNGVISCSSLNNAISASEGRLYLAGDLEIYLDINGGALDGNCTGLDIFRADVVIDGTKFTNFKYSSDYNSGRCIMMMDEGNSLTIYGGEFSGEFYLGNADENIKLCGGKFDAITKSTVNKADFFDLLGDGYTYKFAGGKPEVFGKVLARNIEVVKSPFASFENENKRVDFGYDSPVKLTVGADNLTYQWYLNEEAIDGAEVDTYTVPVGLSAGKYKYSCIAVNDDGCALYKTIMLTVYCAHENLDESGKCESCGGTYQGAILRGAEAEYYENIYDAARALEKGDVLKLLCDVELPKFNPEEDSSDGVDYNYVGELDFNAQDAVFDLNGKTISLNSDDMDGIRISSGGLTLKNGKADMKITVSNDGFADFDNVEVTGTLGMYSSRTVKIHSGKFARLETYNVNSLKERLAVGKALRLSDGSWSDGSAGTLENVSVVSAPAYISVQPQGIRLKPGYTDGSLSVEAVKNEGYEDKKIAYQWYDENGNALGGETSGTFAVPLGIGDGQVKRYSCAVTCDGYTERSISVAVVVGNVLPTLELSYEWESVIMLRADGKGGRYTVAVASYTGDKMTDIKLIVLTDKDNSAKGQPENDFNLNMLGCDRVKAFIFEDMQTLKPALGSAELSLKQ